MTIATDSKSNVHTENGVRIGATAGNKVASVRDLTREDGGAPNAHRHWYAARRDEGTLLSALRISRNYVVITAAKHLPSLHLKRVLFRALGMKLGKNVTIASGAMLDYFFPELIEIDDNTIVGMDALILTHEFFHDHFRKGPVRIGKNVLLAARSTVLAGVTIGDGAVVAAGSLVSRDVPPATRVAGQASRPLLSRAHGATPPAP